MIKNQKIFFEELDEHGVRMMKVVCWALELHVYGKTTTIENDWQELISRENIEGSADDWNKAIGFTNTYWGSGGQIYPYISKDAFRQLVSEKWTSSYDEAWDISIYDKQGRELEITVEEVSVEFSSCSTQTFDNWAAAEPARLEAEKIKAEAALRRKTDKEAKKAKLKQKALQKLSAEERKALGI